MPRRLRQSGYRTSITLFLDFDAVLHGDEVYRTPDLGVELRGPGHLFEHAPALETALIPFRSLRIVLSTSWVPTFGYAHARSRLPTRLAARVVGSTYHAADTPDWRWQTRYEQIASYIERHRVGARWLAIDDDLVGWPESQLHHVVCPSDIQRGLQASDIELVVTRLSRLVVDAR